MKALIDSGVDLLAIETIPAQKEAEALTTLLAEYPTWSAWLTYSCKVDLLLPRNHLLFGSLSDFLV